jgi:MFS family permease
MTVTQPSRPSDVDGFNASGVQARQGIAIVFLLMATVFTSHFNRVSIATAGDTRIMKQYDVSPTRMGLVYSAFLLAYTLSMIPGGLFIDRFGARTALTALGFGSALFVALTGAVGLMARSGGPWFVGLLIVRGLLGVVSAPLHPACARMVGNLFPPGLRSRVNGLVTGSALAGIALTPIGFGTLIGLVDWSVAFLVTAGVTTGLAFVWFSFATDSPRRGSYRTVEDASQARV